MPRDDGDDDCKRSSKACESKGDDDYVTAVGSALPSAAEPKAALGLRGLDISAVVKSERNPRPCAEHERVERALDAQVLVVFELPDGSEGEKHFKMGHTVEVLKSFVEEEFEIPMGIQSLYLDETLMLDPLSLSDYPAIDPARDCFVRVGGEIPEQAQKK